MVSIYIPISNTADRTSTTEHHVLTSALLLGATYILGYNFGVDFKIRVKVRP